MGQCANFQGLLVRCDPLVLDHHWLPVRVGVRLRLSLVGVVLIVISVVALFDLVFLSAYCGGLSTGS